MATGMITAFFRTARKAMSLSRTRVVVSVEFWPAMISFGNVRRLS